MVEAPFGFLELFVVLSLIEQLSAIQILDVQFPMRIEIKLS